MKKEILLNGKWRLYMADAGEIPAYSVFNTLEKLEESGFKSITGSVPGNFELDMQAAGLAEDYYYADNVLEAQKNESLHLWYSRKFKYEEKGECDEFLTFCGIDTFAEIYLNGELIANTDNMFLTYEIPVSGRLLGENDLTVHIKPTVIEAQRSAAEPGCTVFQKYNADSLTVRKAPHMFGWDISPRIISGGMWRDVRLDLKPRLRIEEIYMYTVKLEKESAVVWCYFRLSSSSDIKKYSLRIKGECCDDCFAEDVKLWHNEGKIVLNLKKPKLWWPKNMGAPDIYDITAELACEDKVFDTYKFGFGVRTVYLERTSITDDNGSGEFKFFINGEPMFVMGTNWVPLDSFHSRDKERLPQALSLLDDIGCNAVRCWGGSVYEDDEFFDFCDRHGIAVWQDFAMGCAVYPQNEQFCNKIREETEHIVKKLRNHPSLILWAGDNEVDETYTQWSPFKRDPNKNRLTRQIIPDVLERLDPIRPYLPSSPYIDETAYNADKLEYTPEKHLWGPRDYFKGDYYSNSPAHFASETGYHGCPSPESIKKFISPENLWPYDNNDEWIIHSSCMERGSASPYSYRIPLMVSQVRTLWGTVPDTLEEFSLASQISQAEADKYFIERFRSGKWRRTGIIWWNLLDCWPQFSDAVVDYYFNKKLAYHYIKRSQAPICLFMSEEKGVLRLMAANEYSRQVSVEYKVTELTENKLITEGRLSVDKFSTAEISLVKRADDKMRFYLIVWSAENKSCKNHYIDGKPPYDLKAYLKCGESGGLLAKYDPD